MKISQRKLSRIRATDQIWVARACDICKENLREQAQIRENKFSPSKVFRYIELGFVSKLIQHSQ